MLNAKFIASLKDLNSRDLISLRHESFEYVLRYFEINTTTIVSRYKSYYRDLWHVELASTFSLLYLYLEVTNDIRLINTLVKFKRIIESLNIQYEGNALHHLLDQYLKKICN